MSWLLGHWELKLVSLVVAVALWTYTSGQVRVERTVQVEIRPEQVTGLPADLRATAVTPSQFEVVLSVPTRKVDDLRDDVLRPQIPIPREHRGAEPVEIALTSRALGLDSDIRIQRTDPAHLQALVVQVANIVEAVLPAEPPPVVGLPPGLAADVVLDRTQIQVRGLREVVDAASERQRLRFAPVQLEGIPADLAVAREERVEVHALPGQPEPVDPVMARVTVHPDRMLEVTLRLPVALLLPADAVGRWEVAENPTAELHLHGPENTVRGIVAADLNAWIDLRSVELVPGPLERQVHVALPPGVTAPAATLRITLRQAASGG